MAIACTTTLPSVRADYCTTGVVFGRIDTIYFTRVGDGLTDWTDDTEWNTRLDNTTAAPSAGDYPIRYLNVIGSLAAPEQQETEISLARKVYSDPDFSLPFACDDIGTLNYDFTQTLIANNGGVFAAWFAGGGYMYGGTDGTDVTMSISPEIPEDRKDIVRLRGTLKWTGGLPNRIANPL